MSDSPTPRPADPIDKVVFRSQSLRFALGFAAVGWALAVAGPFAAFQMGKPDMGLAVVDPAGDLAFQPPERFLVGADGVRRGGQEHLPRPPLPQPGRPRRPQLWSAIFTEAGRKKAKKLVDDTATYFRDNQIFQSVKCGKIQVVQEPSQDGKKVTRAVAWCQILQNGTMNGAAFTEPFTLKVSITLVRNDDFLTNGMFPLVANDFTLERQP